MSRTKSKPKVSVLKTVFEGLKIYLCNLDIFVKYLSFPVLGTFIGMFILFWINYCYVVNLEKLQASNPIFNNAAVILTLVIILTIPGFLIMIKAFVDYIVAFGALNSMCVNDQRIADVHTHNEIIKRRFAPYCVLLIVLSIIFGALSFPILIPLLILALVFLALAVQVFTLEEDSSPFDAITKSLSLVKSNFWAVFWVLVIITLISYVAVPYLVTWAVSKTPMLTIMANPVEKYISLLPINDFNSLMTELGVPYKFDVIIFSEMIVQSVISTIVIMYMLPFRCACCVSLYKNLSEFHYPIDTENVKSKPKRKKKEA